MEKIAALSRMPRKLPTHSSSTNPTPIQMRQSNMAGKIDVNASTPAAIDTDTVRM